MSIIMNAPEEKLIKLRDSLCTSMKIDVATDEYVYICYGLACKNCILNDTAALNKELTNLHNDKVITVKELELYYYECD